MPNHAEQAGADSIMTGADILLKSLMQENVEWIFGYPGGAVIPIYDALFECSKLKHVLTRHEQAAVHAADGYARITGKPGVALVTSGPGATNALTGIANAYMDSVPLVVLTGQVPTNLIGRDSFQEVNIFGMTMDITKHNYLVRDVRDLARIVKEAFSIASTGRPGPVVIDLPKNVMTAKTNYVRAADIPIRGYNPIPKADTAALHAAAKKIEQAKKPVILAGGGIIAAGASEFLFKLASSAKIPVVSTLMGIGAFPSGHPLHLGMIGMHGTFAANKAVHQCDLLICLGVRFSDRVTGQMKAFSPHSYKIHVDIDAAEIGKNVDIDASITADLREVMSFLNEKRIAPDTGDWLAATSEWKRKSPKIKAAPNRLTPQEVIMLLDKFTGGEAIVVTDVGQHQIWTAHHYAFNAPRSFLTSGGLGTMGFGLPAAIGTAFAAPQRPILCITGDGSFQMNLQELMTVADYQLPIKVAILNNGYLGMVRQWQELFYNRRYSSVRISSPDYVALAKSYGIIGIRCKTPEEAEEAIPQVMDLPGPALLEFDVREEENVYPMVPPGSSNTNMILPDEQAPAQ